jgi:hypothetical protein
VGSGVEVAGEDYDPINREPIDPNAPTTYDDTIFIVENATVHWADKGKEYEFLSGGRVRPGDVLIRTKLEDVLMSGTDVNNETIFHHARKIIVDGQTVKPAVPPRKTGIRDLYTVDIWCKLVDVE